MGTGPVTKAERKKPPIPFAPMGDVIVVRVRNTALQMQCDVEIENNEKNRKAKFMGLGLAYLAYGCVITSNWKPLSILQQHGTEVVT
jgi:hypothetical protein